ncbi:MAG: thioredoxin domain-containing protein [Desulfuromonadales bacterium]|nr:thioredoxin domain-containing protein [Desulfuromonadales bacterium]
MTSIRHGLLTLLLLCGLTGTATATLEWTLAAEQPLPAAPVDLLLHPGDGRTFVLLDGGQIQVYAGDGRLEAELPIGSGANRIALSADGQRLYVTNTRTKSLQTLDIAYIYDLSVGKSPVKGAMDAPVTLTVFDDFQCPYCARLVPLLNQLIEDYPGQVRLVFKHFPLRMHKHAEFAALASLAAREQGKFWGLHDLLFANYNKLDEPLIRALAEQAGLDMARFEKDLANTTLRMEVDADLRLGQQVGVRGTPTLFLNGKPVQDRTLAVLRQLIDRELARLDRQQ